MPPMRTDLFGQLIMTGVPGKELDGKTAKIFRKVKPGAFILFGRNIESAPQLRKLIDDLRDLSEIEPIITVDQEGGRVSISIYARSWISPSMMMRIIRCGAGAMGKRSNRSFATPVRSTAR